MNVLIIEDEATAVDKLRAMLASIDPGIRVLAALESVKATVAWLKSNPAPDLAFVDIQLSDDSSFEIFKQFEVRFPIVFTTAYDDYILESFEYSSIDYLLKPIQTDRLRKALDKVRKLETHFIQHKFNELFNKSPEQESRKQRYVVKKGVDFISVNVKDIAYCFTEYRIVFLRDREGNKYIIDKTITELQEELDSKEFFRANRKYLVSIEAIGKFRSDNGKILLELIPSVKEDVVVSKENAPNFRNWVEG
ncbi:MAG: LytTR family DNA-binding domain-containing protein [Roseivirga sp.]